MLVYKTHQRHIIQSTHTRHKRYSFILTLHTPKDYIFYKSNHPHHIHSLQLVLILAHSDTRHDTIARTHHTRTTLRPSLTLAFRTSLVAGTPCCAMYVKRPTRAVSSSSVRSRGRPILICVSDGPFKWSIKVDLGTPNSAAAFRTDLVFRRTAAAALAIESAVYDALYTYDMFTF